MTQSNDFPNIFTFPKSETCKDKTVIFSDLLDDEVAKRLSVKNLSYSEELFDAERDQLVQEKARLFVDFLQDMLPGDLFYEIADLMAEEA